MNWYKLINNWGCTDTIFLLILIMILILILICISFLVDTDGISTASSISKETGQFFFLFLHHKLFKSQCCIIAQTLLLRFFQFNPIFLCIIYNLCTLHNAKYFLYSLKSWLELKLSRFINKWRKTNWNGFPVFASDAS